MVTVQYLKTKFECMDLMLHFKMSASWEQQYVLTIVNRNKTITLDKMALILAHYFISQNCGGLQNYKLCHAKKPTKD